MDYAVLGAGQWGTSFSYVIAQKDDVFLWSKDEDLVNRIQFDRKNDLYFPNVKLPYEIRASYDLQHVVKESDIVVIAGSPFDFQDVLDEIVDELPNLEAVITLPTGFDPESGRRLSQEYLERMETLENFYVIAGPVLPQELIEEQPTTAVLAGQENHNRDRICSSLYRSYFRLFESDDLIGAESFNAIKSVLGFSAGLCAGLGLPEGTRASLLVRGIHESKKLIEFEGGESQSLLNLDGIGGIFLESTSESSPNYWLGRLIGKGQTLEEAQHEITGRTDCVTNARAIHQRILKGEIKAPLFSELFRVIHGDVDTFKAVDRVLNLDDFPRNSI